MLKINNKDYKILLSEINYVNATHNKQKRYSILINIKIGLNGIKGYISFYADFFNNNDFKNIENKEDIELPTELNSKIDSIEILDTKEFIDSNVTLKVGNIIDGKIEMKLSVNDELIKLEYQEMTDIK